MNSRVGSLRIFTDETKDDQNEELPVDSTRYKTVESIIDQGLCILETSKGRESLANTAIEIIKKRNQKRQHHLYGDRTFDEMPTWIDRFLVHLRDNFPNVYLAKMAGEGMVIRYDWGDDMESYDPKTAAELHLNKVIINNMIYAKAQKDNSNYIKFNFQMFITVAHESIHFLTGYLTGKQLPLTPPGVSLSGYGNTTSGESGRYWEKDLPGGVVEFYEDSRDPLGNKQAGIPYLISDGRSNAPAKLVSPNYIKEFVSGNFSFPIRTTGKSTTRSELRKASRETSVLRRGKHATTNTSPTRGNNLLVAESDPPAPTRLESGGSGGESYNMPSSEASESYWTWDSRYGKYYHMNADGTASWANEGGPSQ